MLGEFVGFMLVLDSEILGELWQTSTLPDYQKDFLMWNMFECSEISDNISKLTLHQQDAIVG